MFFDNITGEHEEAAALQAGGAARQARHEGCGEELHSQAPCGACLVPLGRRYKRNGSKRRAWACHFLAAYGELSSRTTSLLVTFSMMAFLCMGSLLQEYV